MSNLPYFGAVLYFAASSLLFATPRAHHLADVNAYFLIFTGSMLTLITVLNVLGLNIGKWLNNLGAVGMALPVLTLSCSACELFSTLWLRHPFHLGEIPQAHVRAPHPLVYDFLLQRL